MRRLLLLAFTTASIITTNAGLAQTYEATRPGVGCTAADALARLTKPDGDSLSEGPRATLQARQTAAAGGCSPFRQGQRVQANEVHTNTIIASADLHDGRGERNVYVPLADFRRVDATLSSQSTGQVPTSSGSQPGLKGGSLPVPPASSTTLTGRDAAIVPSDAGAPTIAGIQIGMSYTDVHSLLHRQFFIRTIRLSDPALQMLAASTNDGSHDVSVEFLDGKAVYVRNVERYQRPFQPANPNAPLQSELSLQEIAEHGRPNAPPVAAQSWMTEWDYDAAGQRVAPTPGCNMVQDMPVSAPRLAADEPSFDGVVMLGSVNAQCGIRLRSLVSPNFTSGASAGSAAEKQETLAASKALYDHLLDAKAKPVAPRQPQPLADADDEPSAEDLAQKPKSLSLGAYSLGQDIQEIRAHVPNGFILNQSDVGIPGGEILLLVRDDRQERFVIQGADGKVVAIAHDQHFALGKEPLKQHILDLAVNAFGPHSKDRFNYSGIPIPWAYGRTGTLLPNEFACDGYHAVNVTVAGDDGSGPMPISQSPQYVSGFVHGCTRSVVLTVFTDPDDPNLLTGLNTTVIDLGELEAFVTKTAEADRKAKSDRERAASQNDSSL